jgi:uncharacterized protein YqcC (DUF446 family)
MHDALAAALVALETQLRAAGLWSTTAPPAAALASTVPFAADTLRLEQWLQFVLCVRLHALLAARAPLPTGSHIAAMAEVCWAGQGGRAELLRCLRDLDQLLN